LLALGAAGVQILTVYFLLSVAGNLVSVLAPYRIAAGSLKPTKAPAKKMLLIFLSHLLFPIALVPMAFPAAMGALAIKFQWLPGSLVELVLSLVLAIVVAGLYWLTLRSLGHLLQRRERDVLQAVTQEIE
jgi:hypothetical protein